MIQFNVLALLRTSIFIFIERDTSLKTESVSPMLKLEEKLIIFELSPEQETLRIK